MITFQRRLKTWQTWYYSWARTKPCSEIASRRCLRTYFWQSWTFKLR